MANFRRRRPAHRTSSRSGHQSHWDRLKFERKHGFRWWFCGSWPAAWDITYHRRPARRAEAAVTSAVFRGDLDADEACWPVNHKPHRYYW